MGLVAFGGFVVSTKSSGNYVGTNRRIDEETLKKIADILGIPVGDSDKLASEFESIFIYRGDKKPKPG